MKKFTLGLFLFFHVLGFSQSKVVDSLKLLLKQTTFDTAKCELLNLMIENENNDSLWPIYNYELLSIAENNLKKNTGHSVRTYKEYYASALSNLGYLNMQKGKSAAAYEYYNKALVIQTEIHNKRGIAVALINLGYMFRQEGNILKAIELYHQALKIQLEVDEKEGAATSYNNIAFIFDSQGEYQKAFEYYKKSLELYTQINHQDGMAHCYNNMAYIYRSYGDPFCNASKEVCLQKGILLATDYLKRSIKIREQIGDKSGLANSLNLLAGILDSNGDPDCKDEKHICLATAKQKVYDLLMKALQLRKEVDDVSGIILSYNSLAAYFLKYEDLNKALEYGIMDMRLSKEIGAPEKIMDAAEVLKQIYAASGKYKEALQMNDLFLQMKDSISNEEIQQMTMRKTFQIEYEKKATADSIRVAEEKKITEVQLKQERTQRFALYGGLVLVGLFGAFMFNRFKITKRQNLLIHKQKTELQKQKELVEEHQKETLDSIHYAKRIQSALIANSDFITQNIPNNFIYFNPKDIVSGDFYWATMHNDKFYFAVCDSTGHGVPGAFMSLLNMGFLSEAIKEKNIEKPNEVFNYVRDRLISTISDGGQKDGMDGILICINKAHNVIEYAAANNEPILIRNNEIIELPKDKMPVGKGEKAASFTLHTVSLEPNDSLYLYTDGFADQFGGPKGKKYKYKQLNELLLSLKELPLYAQKDRLESEFRNWKGSQDQVDDVLVIGIKI